MKESRNVEKTEDRNVKPDNTSSRVRQGRRSSILQEESEAEEHAAEQDSHARGSTGDECARGGTALVASRSASLGGATTEASDGDLVCGGTGGGLCGGHCAQEGGVAEEGRLCTAGVVLAVETRLALSSEQ